MLPLLLYAQRSCCKLYRDFVNDQLSFLYYSSGKRSNLLAYYFEFPILFQKYYTTTYYECFQKIMLATTDVFKQRTISKITKVEIYLLLDSQHDKLLTKDYKTCLEQYILTRKQNM